MKGLYKGMLAGMVVGATISMIANPIEEKKRRMIKKKVGKTVRVVGNILDDINMFS